MKARIQNLLKIIAPFVAFCGTVTVLIQNLHAQNTIMLGNQKVTMLPSLVQIGMDLTIDVDLSALSLEITYDPAILEINATDILSSNELIQPGISPLVTVGNSTINWSVSSLLGTAINSGNGRLFTMNFAVNNSLGSTTSLALGNITATSTSFAEVQITGVNGEIIGLSTIILSESGGSTEPVENGSSDTYTIVLNTQPSSDVTVNIQSDNQVQTDLNQVIFTDSNWNSPRVITVTAVDDAFSEGPHSGVIMHFTASDDVEYDGLSVMNIQARVKDDDGISVGFVINASATPDESDASHSVSLQLSLPNGNTLSGPVSVNVMDLGTGTAQAGQDYSSFGTETFVFPVGSVDDEERTINLGILDDALDEENKTVILGLAAVLGANLGVQNEHIVTITDDDMAGVEIVESELSTLVEEGGGTDTYTINLASEPRADVVITLITDPQLEPDVSSVTFTPSDWNMPKLITVSAKDDDEFEGNFHTGSIAHSADSLDALYKEISIQEINVQITDNDIIQNVLSISSMSVTGMTASIQIPVTLSVDRDLSALTMKINFDSSLLSTETAKIVPSEGHFFDGVLDQITLSVDSQNGVISWSVSDFLGNGVIRFGTGELFTIEFTIKSPITDQSMMTLSSVEASDLFLNSFTLVAENGVIILCDDSDMDTLCDDWEIEHFGELLRFDDDDDPDHDGVSNLDEFKLGTDPFVLELMLNAGWNLFSIGVQPQANSVSEIFGDTISSPVWEWNAQNQQNRVALTITSTKGYWVYSKVNRQNENAVLIDLP